ncbi:hypothetical protein CYMTET_20747 [Cymbomonas tetramitiformis]|uniref:Uncharacterized protein n=1 Tax=Cymbomonas tetramitiformis TaxID=36881 RepID=A0AAE0G3E8_9CHLO|nr:hypothetical protein CYMTET_20747 [Cymbomonas tetramitiformis]
MTNTEDFNHFYVEACIKEQKTREKFLFHQGDTSRAKPEDKTPGNPFIKDAAEKELDALIAARIRGVPETADKSQYSQNYHVAQKTAKYSEARSQRKGKFDRK